VSTSTSAIVATQITGNNAIIQHTTTSLAAVGAASQALQNLIKQAEKGGQPADVWSLAAKALGIATPYLTSFL